MQPGRRIEGNPITVLVKHPGSINLQFDVNGSLSRRQDLVEFHQRCMGAAATRMDKDHQQRSTPIPDATFVARPGSRRRLLRSWRRRKTKELKPAKCNRKDSRDKQDAHDLFVLLHGASSQHPSSARRCVCLSCCHPPPSSLHQRTVANPRHAPAPSGPVRHHRSRPPLLPTRRCADRPISPCGVLS